MIPPDGKSVRYSIPLSDYIELKRPVMFEVKWYRERQQSKTVQEFIFARRESS